MVCSIVAVDQRAVPEGRAAMVGAAVAAVVVVVVDERQVEMVAAACDPKSFRTCARCKRINSGLAGIVGMAD